MYDHITKILQTADKSKLLEKMYDVIKRNK